MNKKAWKWLGILIIPGLMLMASCSKKAVISEPVGTEISAASDKGRLTPEEEELAKQRRLEEERLRQERDQMQSASAVPEKSSARNQFVNEDIYFEYDSAVLTSDAQEILKRKADFLNKNTGASVIIEGHCDERGTNEYNMALGERRAESVKAFLLNLGVSASRMTTISYGEERPFAQGQSEESWHKNRRAHFEFR